MNDPCMRSNSSRICEPRSDRLAPSILCAHSFIFRRFIHQFPTWPYLFLEFCIFTPAYLTAAQDLLWSVGEFNNNYFVISFFPGFSLLLYSFPLARQAFIKPMKSSVVFYPFQPTKQRRASPPGLGKLPRLL